MPVRPSSRGALVAAVSGGTALVALLCPPAVVQFLAGAGPPPPAVAPTAAPASVPAPSPVGGTPPDGATPVVGGAPPSVTVDPDAPTPADRVAGIARRTVTPSGSGELDVVPGSTPAPGSGDVRTVRVEVERGLPVDGPRFAGFVLATLNDPRGWGHDGAMTFARTDGDAPITVVLASPGTSARLCGGRRADGRLSCRNGPRAVLTFHRWVHATEEYADNVTGYRQYVVNHEVGHALGHGHELCPGEGRPAPVMQQQTLGLKGCTQNSWPHPDDAGAARPE